MAKKVKAAVLKEYLVPFRLTLEGDLFVEATSPAEARAIADESRWDDDTFFSRASFVDWKVTGDPTEG